MPPLVITETVTENVTQRPKNKPNEIHEPTLKYIRDPSLKWYQFDQPLKIHNIILLIVLHTLFVISSFSILWALTLQFLRHAAFQYIYVYATSFGVTGGAHRLWTHRTFKASTLFRVYVMCCFMGAGQNSIKQWVLDHRVHHKFSETIADPHDASRGFFFAHCGWLMMRKHPEVIKKGKQIDMSDVLSDPVVRFSERYYMLLKILFTWILPVGIPVYFWNEPIYNTVMFRIFTYVLSLNGTWLVNSAAHLWGPRPYDNRINPAENTIVSWITQGEGYHNYHHTFPWDYRAAETYLFNTVSMWIDLGAYLGVVTDRRKPSNELIEKVMKKYGDGSGRFEHGNEVEYTSDY